MKVIKWFGEADVKGNIEKFIKKYDIKDLDGTKDAELFFLAQSEAALLSKTTDDEDKKDLWENMETDIEEYTSLAYFIEIRGTSEKFIIVLKDNENKLGKWEGPYEPMPDIKNNIYMEWAPAVQLKIMKGNPNTDAEFFSGALTVKGSLKLATKPRQWIYDFFDFIGREVD